MLGPLRLPVAEAVRQCLLQVVLLDLSLCFFICSFGNSFVCFVNLSVSARSVCFVNFFLRIPLFIFSILSFGTAPSQRLDLIEGCRGRSSLFDLLGYLCLVLPSVFVELQLDRYRLVHLVPKPRLYFWGAVNVIPKDRYYRNAVRDRPGHKRTST